ncbi:hypothetical protein GCM10010297_11380 [Streptomyces malachitofuscus]|nr:hypothetical protein GCM10010297_11380 [Streptomyces malachitofuscus]
MPIPTGISAMDTADRTKHSTAPGSDTRASASPRIAESAMPRPPVRPWPFFVSVVMAQVWPGGTGGALGRAPGPGVVLTPPPQAV